jgi:uncharacterized protein
MLFEWDQKKNTSNIGKHKISFELAASIFDDPLHLSVLDSKSKDEERWITVGSSVIGKVLVIVHTYKGSDDNEIVRIVSARQATRKEKKQYEEGI